eukprot:scaffold369_cov281-Pinguiococcus_pyrenoidosus.AAC.2
MHTCHTSKHAIRILLERIENQVQEALKCLTTNGVPCLLISGRVVSLRPKAAGSIRSRCTFVRKYVGMWAILSQIHKLLCTGTRITLRCLYYSHEDLFQSIEDCERLVKVCGSLLRVPRHHLGIVNTSRGYLAGRLKLRFDAHGPWNMVEGPTSIERIGSEWLYSLDSVSRAARDKSIRLERLVLPSGQAKYAQVVDTDCDVVLQLESSAKVILVIEKDTIFERLVVEDHFCERHSEAICITGRGVPDFATRACVATLHKLLDIPVFVLTDFNPWGVQVFLAFKYPSMSSKMESQLSVVSSAKWLGLSTRQVLRFQNRIAPGALQRMKKGDVQKATSLVDFARSQDDEDIADELQQMLAFGRKCELEAINDLTSDYLASTFICHELHTRNGM